MNFLTISPLYPEKKGFQLRRSDIGDTVIFCHFLTPVIANLGGTETKIQPGGCVFWDAHAFQQFSSPDCDLLHNWFHSDTSVYPYLEKYGLEFEMVYYPRSNDEITKLFQQLDIEKMQQAAFFEHAIDTIAESLFIALARSDKAEKVSAPIDPNQKEIFLQARSHIHMNISEPWTVEKMAALTNLSPSRFYNLYQKFFGTSPQNDLIHRRIQAAQNLLLRENLSIATVAELTGYTNQYHFIRQFRQITGTSPSLFRKGLKSE